MENRAALKIQGLCKTFDQLKAVDNVSMHIETGEILGLIGPNGSGKSTLINIMTGMLVKNSGSVLIDDQDITAVPAYQVPKYGLTRTYQTARLFKNLSCLENVMMGAISVGMKRKQAFEIAMDLMEEMGISDKADELAQGQTLKDQRLIEIARALAAKPKFMLLDEPAAGMNEIETDELLNLLKRMPEEKQVGIMIVDHDMRLIMELCDRLHVLNYGQTIAEGKPEEVRKNPQVIKAYLGSTAHE